MSNDPSNDASPATSYGDDLESQLRLALIPGVGPRIQQALLERFSSAAAVLAAPASELCGVDGVGPKLSRVIASEASQVDVEKELALCRQHQIALLTPSHEQYPKLLAEIPDPPMVLFVRGKLSSRDALSVAIVGSRHATRYGLRQAERLGASLAQTGFTVVSGLARGIDAAAHRGALSAGGRTIAVLGSGLLNIYPPEHGKLAEEVQASGAILTEAPPLRTPTAGAFPQRNRIISGVSLGVIVVEAGERSGALITARLAMEQNREVFAVPGQIDNRLAHGCHRLLKDGARLVESVDDVLEELGPLAQRAVTKEEKEIRHPAELQLNEQERKILDCVSDEPTSIDAIVAESGLPAHRVLATISVLEVRRLIQRISGQQVVRR